MTTFPTPVKPGATEHCERLFTKCQDKNLSTAQTAYVLATADHESLMGYWMTELGSTDYFTRLYGYRTDKGRELGNTEPGDGARFRGRGYVQITGRSNYAFWANRTGLPLLTEPELACDPAVAAEICVAGMQLGSFTGHSLDEYINQDKTDFYNARRVVTYHLDRPEKIASRANEYLRAFTSSENVSDEGPASTRNVQEMLKEIGWPIAVDGELGPQTKTAILRFQQGYLVSELVCDGIAGPITTAALEECLANDGRASEHFKFREFASKNNDDIWVRRELVHACEVLRAHMGRPLPLLSAYRDPQHNNRVGGVTRSRHLVGEAVDITSRHRLRPQEVANLGVFAGIGHRDGWVVHLDVRGIPAGSAPANGSPQNPVIFAE